MTAEEPPQTQAELVLALLATAQLVWSPLLLLAAVFLAASPPLPPAFTGLVAPPTAWIAWTAAIVYLAAAAACHGRLALLARRKVNKLSPHGGWLVISQGALTATAAWCCFSGPVNAANLAGLGPTAAVTLVVSFLSLLLTSATSIVASKAASVAGSAPSRDTAAQWLSLLVALASLATAASLLLIQTSLPEDPIFPSASRAELKHPLDADR